MWDPYRIVGSLVCIRMNCSRVWLTSCAYCMLSILAAAELIAPQCLFAAEPPPVLARGEKIEEVKDLGFGFRRVVVMAPGVGNSSFEIGHYGFLYYRDRRLSQTSEFSISPSGQYAVFQDGPTGDTVLFTRKTETLKHIYAGSMRGHALEYMWGFGERSVTIVFDDNKRSKPIHLD